MSFRRPVPARADSIGPWLFNLSFLSWLACLTTSTLVFLFSHNGEFHAVCDQRLALHLVVVVLIAEHGYWVVDSLMGYLSARVWTTGEIDTQREEYAVRRRYLANLGLDGSSVLVGDAMEKRREAVAEDDPIGFWAVDGGVDQSVVKGREILVQSWERKKSQ
jgi:anoctamin-10